MDYKITEIEERLLAKLQEVDGLNEVKAYSGDVDEILNYEVTKSPAAFVVFNNRENRLDTNEGMRSVWSWRVILLTQSFKGSGEARHGAMELADNIKDKLEGFMTDSISYVERIEHIYSEPGFVFFGIDVHIETWR